MSYFRPWRRKFGVLILLMAYAFMSEWVNSLYSTSAPWLTFSPSQKQIVFVIAEKSQLCLVRMPAWCAGQVERSLQGQSFWISRLAVDGLWRLGEFALGNNVSVMGVPMDVVVIPYWSIVLPLTALSAWLLLSKPRQKAQTEQRSIRFGIQEEQ